MGEIIDKVKDKAKDVKDKVVDTTKGVGEKTKETVTPSSSPSSSSDSSYSDSSSSTQDRRYEEGGPGTEVGRNDDPLTEYRDKEPMTPARLKEHEPTAVRRDSTDQKITEEGQTGTDTEQANELLRKRGMTKLDSNTSDTSGSDTSGSATVTTETTTTETTKV